MMFDRKGRETPGVHQTGRRAARRKRNGRVHNVVAALVAAAALGASAVAAVPAEARQNEVRITCYDFGEWTTCVCRNGDYVVFC